MVELWAGWERAGWFDGVLESNAGERMDRSMMLLGLGVTLLLLSFPSPLFGLALSRRSPCLFALPQARSTLAVTCAVGTPDRAASIFLRRPSSRSLMELMRRS